MSFIKDFKDRLFLGKLGVNPAKLGTSTGSASVLSVEADGTISKGSASVTAAPLTGLPAGTNTAITASDTVLQALAKLHTDG